MLARASSDAGTRVRRSKSTSTVHRHPLPISEPLDPEVAQQHAVTAAAVAFSRAQAQAAKEPISKRSSEIFRSKSNASRKSLTSQGQGSHFPTRDSSFRSLNAQKPGQATGTQRKSRASTLNTEKFPPLLPIPASDRPVSAPRPLSAQPSIAFSEHSRSSIYPRANRQSASSSATSQQIRKARSMYYASSIQTGSPIARPPAKYLTTPSTINPSPELPVTLPPTRKLAPSPLASPRIPVTIAGDETLDQARDNYLQSFQQRSIKHKPSLFLAPFKKRRDKSKEKGKRLSSGVLSVSLRGHQTGVEPTGDVTLNESVPQRIKEKRSFSGSLKSRFKSVFRRASNKSSNLPVQQIEASRDYFDTTFSSPDEVHTSHAVPSPDGDLLRRVRSRTPSLDTNYPVFLRPTSRSSSHGSARSDRSQRSLHSEANSTNPSMSRVTSWCTSSTKDTLAQRAIKRLTVIHESKDSIGSEAENIVPAMVKRKSLPFTALAAFRDPMPMEDLGDSSTAVDPNRVFSALMKEISTTKTVDTDTRPVDRTPGAESDVFESSKTKELHSSAGRDFRPSTASEHRPPSRRAPSVAAQSTQSKTSSIRTLGRAIRSTIRTVTPGEHQSSPCPKGTTFSFRGNKRTTKQDASSSPSSASGQSDTHESRMAHETTSRDVFSASPTQIERRVEKAKNRWKAPLDDAEQLHTPRELDRTYAISKLDDIKLLRDTSNNYLGPSGPLKTVTEPQANTFHALPASPISPVSTNPRPVMSPLSPSVYSRNTDGVSIFPNDSILSMDEPIGTTLAQDGGSAVILNSQSVRSYVVGTPTRCRPESTRTSRDWKAWLSHEVSSMEIASEQDLKIDECYLPSPTRIHHQDIMPQSDTEHDDTTIIWRESYTKPTSCTQKKVDTTCDAVEPEQSECSSPSATKLQCTRTKSEAHELEGTELHPQTRIKLSSSRAPAPNDSFQDGAFDSRPGSTPLLSMQKLPLSCAHNSSASQPLLETPRSARMNDRFPYLNKSRCSSSNSGRSSRTSKSPPNSVASSSKSRRATPSARVYTDLSAPNSVPSSRIPQTVLKRGELPDNSKENISPVYAQVNSGGSGRLHNSLLGASPRNKSSRPRSSVTPNHDMQSTDQNTTIVLNIKPTKHTSSPTQSSPRPRVRATLRPISPEKLSRRPKSAFDLRGSRVPQPRPASELRRPALHFNSLASSSMFTEKPVFSADDIANGDRSGDGDRSGSITPGQRMADRFLKERKSTGVLESKKYRGGLRLAREDTPAFL